jgi:four helix bundle protein
MLNLSHKNLEVYKISLILVNEIYSITKKFPREELYGLISQLRRAAVSVSSNLAEGAARKSGREKKRFYEISRSSLVEIDTQIEIALMLNHINHDDIITFEKNAESIFKMLSKMITNLDLKPTNQSPLATTHTPLTPTY